MRELEASREIVRLKTLAEQKKNEQELALAQETQESLLPHSLPSFENFRIRAFNNPTRYVGGDFYDFLHLSSGEWMGVLADVSGKGMPAALLSSMVLGALSMEFRPGTGRRRFCTGLTGCFAKNLCVPVRHAFSFSAESGRRWGTSSARDIIRRGCSARPREESKI